MGTRGSFGFHLDGQDLLSYNQFDSYPEGKGEENLAWLRTYLEHHTVDDLCTAVRGLRVVREQGPLPTPEDIKRLAPWTDLRVSEQSPQDWYCLTRLSHGSLEAILASGYLMEANTFILDSLFCEWAYVVNLDDETFEIYRGFQKAPPVGRYSAYVPPPPKETMKDFPTYYACGLVAALPLAALPETLLGLDLYEKDAEEETSA
jgi:hypothetical protein